MDKTNPKLLAHLITDFTPSWKKFGMKASGSLTLPTGVCFCSAAVLKLPQKVLVLVHWMAIVLR